MTRMMADCRRWPSDTNCSLTIIGEEEEVVRAAAEHAASVHGHEDTPEMREQLRGFLEPADAFIEKFDEAHRCAEPSFETGDLPAAERPVVVVPAVP